MARKGWASVVSKSLLIGAAACALPYLLPLPRTEEQDPRELAPSDQFLPVEGLLTHYRSWGEGKPIVMIHGFWSWSFTWEPSATLLTKSGYRCLAPDLKGFGLTEKPRHADYSHRALARFVIGFMDAIGVDKAVLAGSSMGGNVALHAALSYPERVAGLILLAPAVFVPWALTGRLWSVARFPPMRRTLKHILRRYATSEVSRQAITRSYLDARHVDAELVRLYRLPLKTPGWDEAIIEMLSCSQHNPIVNRLPHIWQPTLVLWGKHDRVIPPQWAQRLAMSMPHCQIQFIANAGHLPHEEQPEATVRAVEAFLISEDRHLWT